MILPDGLTSETFSKIFKVLLFVLTNYSHVIVLCFVLYSYSIIATGDYTHSLANYKCG